MWLDKWLFEKKMSIADLARKLHVSRMHLNSIVNKRRMAGTRLARDIEIFTEGKVSAKTLRGAEIKGFRSTS